MLIESRVVVFLRDVSYSGVAYCGMVTSLTFKAFPAGSAGSCNMARSQTFKATSMLLKNGLATCNIGNYSTGVGKVLAITEWTGKLFVC